MTKRNKIFVELLAIFLAVALVFLFGVKVTNAENCATGVVKGSTLYATCQKMNWYSCPSGYTHTSRVSVTDLRLIANCASGNDTCCFKDTEVEDQARTCSDGKGRCEIWSSSTGDSACTGTDKYIGQESCSSGYACCVPATTTDVGVGTTNPTANNAGVGGSSPTTAAAGTTGVGGTSSSGARTGSTGGLVPCTDDCTLCHLVVGIKNIFDYLLYTVLFPLFMLGIVVSGVLYMVSSGSKGLTEKAKTALTYSITGFVLALTAWLMVNFVMLTLGFKNPLGGSWYNFTCDTSQSKTAASSTTGTTTTGTAATGTANGDCGGIKTVGNSSSQCGTASPELSSLLQCINNKLGSNSGVYISSNGLNRGTGCHGGGNCSGTANAADLFGGSPTASANAAKECGTADTILINEKAYYGSGNSKVGSQSDHTDHAHVSVNNKKCGCDWGK